ncbi:hypothetical protein ACRE_026670 [Hapsidospora chrysogenum ATCC 11550]|uniref:Uncharacterized protein n=1 Tax=Hapsidospora chrysogenum (strain ATCC 11550 / CBS 779.69 / DSM 880 / IAM 14645 / JCM 23072 / IMI 49137) TaxID=857340 RepID=A0A086TB42_HAPC1|nr:hypothetical protein ACRE_026670 [Hapsidospora chrysogenum ATCC 11550]
MTSPFPGIDPPPYSESVGAPPPPPPQPPPAGDADHRPHDHTAAAAAAEPPAYDDANQSSAKDQLSVTGELILDYRTVYPTDQPDKPLYELNRSPLSGVRGVYAVDKICYRLTTTGADGETRSRIRARRPREIYEFITVLSSTIVMGGKGRPDATFREVKLSRTSSRWQGCKVSGHFTARKSMTQRLLRQGGNEIEWKDTAGKLVAVEPVAAMEDGHGGRPRLQIRAQMTPKEFDLLVTCWLARVYGEAESSKESIEPWQDTAGGASSQVTLLRNARPSRQRLDSRDRKRIPGSSVARSYSCAPLPCRLRREPGETVLAGATLSPKHPTHYRRPDLCPRRADIKKVYDAGDMSAVFKIGEAFCKVRHLDIPGVTREHVTLAWLHERKSCLQLGMDCSKLVFYHCDLGPTNALVDRCY